MNFLLKYVLTVSARAKYATKTAAMTPRNHGGSGVKLKYSDRG
jgi:hypothetical protein